MRADAADRRSRRLALTAPGSALLAEAAAVWRTSHDEIDALVPAAAGSLQAGLREVAHLAAGGGTAEVTR